MSKDAVRSQLNQIQTALQQATELQPESRAALESQLEHLRRLLEQDPLSVTELGPLATRLQQQLLKFETDHPQLTGLLGRLADSLSNLGI